MKRLFFLILLVFVGVAAWRISERLSTDAIGMALGVLFGVLAGIPVALLVLASARRRDGWQDEARNQGRRTPEVAQHGYPMQQPPVIVLAGPGYPAMPQNNSHSNNHSNNHSAPHRLLSAPHDIQAGQAMERRFKVVGEQEEWIEEW